MNKVFLENSTTEIVELIDADILDISIENANKESSKIKMFPNPGSNDLTVEFSESYSNAKIYLESLEDKNIVEYSCPTNKTTIDVSKSELGTYIVKITKDTSIIFINKYEKT